MSFRCVSGGKRAEKAGRVPRFFVGVLQFTASDLRPGHIGHGGVPSGGRPSVALYAAVARSGRASTHSGRYRSGDSRVAIRIRLREAGRAARTPAGADRRESQPGQTMPQGSG